uniref:Uncharacterized protein n=1 Tax=Arundo donax TaxID=35708 RepID=A0A0A9CP86_ARUDO
MNPLPPKSMPSAPGIELIKLLSATKDWARC